MVNFTTSPTALLALLLTVQVLATPTPINPDTDAMMSRRQAAAQPPVLQAQPSVLPDPSLDAGAGNGRNTQFITGRCNNSKDCGQQADLANVCCASIVDQVSGQMTGVCSGSAVGTAGAKLGCGFGDGLANSGAAAAQAAPAKAAAPAAAAAAASTPAPAAAAPAAVSGGTCPAKTTSDSKGPDNVGVNGKQFVTGQCINDANCASGCCVLQAGDGQCRNEPALTGGLKCGFSCTPAA